MADMKIARRISKFGEQHVIFLPGNFVFCIIKFLGLPIALPLTFNFVWIVLHIISVPIRKENRGSSILLRLLRNRESSILWIGIQNRDHLFSIFLGLYFISLYQT